jgi:hypothetical protein
MKTVETEKQLTEEIKKEIDKIIENNLDAEKDENELYKITMYLDYREKYLDEATISKIINNDNPAETWRQIYCEMVDDCSNYYLDEALDIINNELEILHAKDENFNIIDYEFNIIEYFNEKVYCDFEQNGFEGTTLLNIMIDTGDSNTDFTSNSIYPHYDGSTDYEIEKEASLVWLAKTQGYGIQELKKALYEGEFQDSKFLKSVYNELNNCMSHMNILTFMLQIDFKEAIELKTEFLSEKDLNRSYHLCERTGTKSITVSKNTTVGLFDSWSGSGSVLEIELEKDVEIPFKCIFNIENDYNMTVGYSIDSVYGLISDTWTENAIVKTNYDK